MATPRGPRPSFEGPPYKSAFRLIFFLFVLAIVLFEFPGFAKLLESPYSGIDTRNLVIQSIHDGPNRDKDLRPGDVIISVAGERVRNYIHYGNIVAENKDMHPQDYVVARGRDQKTVTVEYTRFDPGRMYRMISFLVVAFAFLLVGIWVYLRRPDLLGSLFATNCLFLAFFLTHRPSVANPVFQLLGELIYDGIMLLFPAVFLHFFLVFPGRPRRDRPHNPLRRILRTYTLPLVIFVVSSVVTTMRFYLRPVDQLAVMAILTISQVYWAGYLVASLAIFITGYRNAPRAQKQKLRVVIAGTCAGILPLVATMLFRHLIAGENRIIEQASVLCLGFVPATYAYAILKHGAIELNDVVRKGLVYAVLSGVVVAAYYLLVQSLGAFMMHEFDVSPVVFTPFTILVLAAIFEPARKRLQRFVDRFFYRGEYVYRQEVYSFNRQLARKLKPDEIFGTFVDRVESLLKSSFIAVYTRGDKCSLPLQRRYGDVPGLPEQFALQSFLGRYFSRFPSPLLVEYLEPAWERRKMDPESRRFVSVPGLAVCLPVVAHDHFICLILVGQKRSGLAYSRADAELLETFAEQLALVLQNAELLESSIEQQRLQDEVMLARDIQLSLLPTSPPSHPDVEILGQMVSSFEVGGDYYDYFFVENDRIAVAVGDVSGKGVPAAMLMSSLQAIFKNLSGKGSLAPAELNAELNSYLVDHAKTEQFATFFYGVLDLRSLRLTFSNAGHCPALLVKRDYVDRLGQGGMLLGVQETARFREGNVLIEPGDLLLLYTDGITEQKNGDGEEYGEDRLIDFLQKNKNLPIGELQRALFDDVVAFGHGRQDDDITSVFVYCKSA